MNTRVLESGKCNITQGYNSNHKAVDMVDGDRKLDYVVVHIAGGNVNFLDVFQRNRLILFPDDLPAFGKSPADNGLTNLF